jgi:hypothetical protein
VPAVTLAHVPSAEPVSAIVQPWQVPVQSVLQHTLLAHDPLAHSLGVEHVAPFDLAVQTIPAQSPLTQSLATLHILVLAQGAHVLPPQSMSVSSPSVTPSIQCIDVQLPLPSQTTPPWSVQATPFDALDVPQTPFMHVGVTQAVPVAGQSVFAWQAGFASPAPVSVLAS